MAPSSSEGCCDLRGPGDPRLVALGRALEDLADEGREVDLSEEMMLITASIILKAMFSSETPESISQMKSAVETMITYVDTQMVPVRVPTWVPSRHACRYFEARDLVHGSIAALIAERRAIQETDWPNDLLSRLMEARDPDTGEAMTETLLRDESITMFFAGHETTAANHGGGLVRTRDAPRSRCAAARRARLRPRRPCTNSGGTASPPLHASGREGGPPAVPSGAFLRAGCHRGRPDRWLRRAVRGHDHALAVLHTGIPTSGPIPTASTPIGGRGMPRPPVTGTPTIPSQPARGSASAATSRCSKATCCSRSSRDASAAPAR